MKEWTKTIVAVVICIMVLVSFLIFLPWGMLGVAFWADDHTYYVLEDCTPVKSQEIIELMELDPPYDLDIVSISTQTVWDGDMTKTFEVQVSSKDEDVLREYKRYIDDLALLPRYGDKHAVYYATIDKNTLSFKYYYLTGGRSDPSLLHTDVIDNGKKTMKLFK